MVMNTIDANMLKKMFLSGAQRLDSKKEWINELNVFPVPDGDTAPEEIPALSFHSFFGDFQKKSKKQKLLMRRFLLPPWNGQLRRPIRQL